MKFNYDLGYISGITGIESERFEELLKYFDGLPIMAKLEVFYISKLIEEDDECAFLQHHFDKNKVAEYGFALFLLAIERLYLLDKKDVQSRNLSSYKLKQIAFLKSVIHKGQQ
ncbi:MAG: hypothetical protein M0012_06050 [Deltaproteobacteria bacterium]|nr:hypothetical protein [Deltaproteobacteria bacterium]